MEKEENIEYNDLPVYYCKDCLSLKIKNVREQADLCYCEDCGSTSIGTTHINDWESMFIEKYEEPFINKDKKYGKKYW